MLQEATWTSALIGSVVLIPVLVEQRPESILQAVIGWGCSSWNATVQANCAPEKSVVLAIILQCHRIAVRQLLQHGFRR